MNEPEEEMHKQGLQERTLDQNLNWQPDAFIKKFGALTAIQIPNNVIAGEIRGGALVITTDKYRLNYHGLLRAQDIDRLRGVLSYAGNTMHPSVRVTAFRLLGKIQPYCP